MNRKDQYAKLFRMVAAAIENLDEEQIDRLVAGKGRLTFAAIEKPRSNTTTPIDQSALLRDLNDCRDREQAHTLLSQISGRDALASFARALKVHVVKHDRREDIEAKIIEFLIGGKLRTEAIRSLNMKGGSSAVAEPQAEGTAEPHEDTKDGKAGGS